MIVVADSPATDLVDALVAAGAFPIIETTWADAPTAFVSVKPTAVVIAEPGAPPNESAARMLCLQIATANGTIVPVIARAYYLAARAAPSCALPAKRWPRWASGSATITAARSAPATTALTSHCLKR